MEKPAANHWGRGNVYEQYVGRWSRQVAPLFLTWLGIPAGRRWLDVGCGTGALCAAIVEGCWPASVVGVEPSEGFLATARENLAAQVIFHRGSAAEIPLPDGSVDATVSGLVLNFVPDAPSALSELVRVTATGGTVGAYVWDYAKGMQLMRFFWDAAVTLDPDAVDESLRSPLGNPEALQALFTEAGLQGVEGTALEIPTPFASFEDYWKPFLGGQGPAPAYTMSLEEDARNRLRDHIRECLPIAADGSISLTARAWAVRGTVTGQ